MRPPFFCYNGDLGWTLHPCFLGAVSAAESAREKPVGVGSVAKKGSLRLASDGDSDKLSLLSCLATVITPDLIDRADTTLFDRLQDMATS